MSIKEARNRTKDALLSGYRHHPFHLEKKISDYVLKGKGDRTFLNILNLKTYADVLAPNHLRGMKNALICFITALSRSAINLGVGVEQSFALSDYYIFEVELQKDEQQLYDLLYEVLEMYREIVHDELHCTYSLPVIRAIRYINQHIFGSCRVHEIGESIKVNPQYLSTIFKNEVGIEPTVYIRQKKMEEAKNLLLQTQTTVSEIAEALGYCNSSHFITAFKKTYGKTPLQYLNS